MMWIIILILFGVYLAYCIWAIDKIYQKWEAEYAETEARKAEIHQKQLPQPDRCPYCGEAIPPATSEYVNCPKCGRAVMTRSQGC
jgi:predicted RNA-binding Zn-ribbon protein involved in translation (DUF1610 family)